MVTIVDYGVGNLFSLSSSLSFLGIPHQISRERDALAQATHILLPGVGAFADAARKLRESGLWQPLLEQADAGKPLLGICLGMQLLFEKSYEYGEHEGLGLIPGSIRPLAADLPPGLKVPHIGWNSLDFVKASDSLLRESQPGDFVYYVHSYYAKDCEPALVATSEYGVSVPGIVRRGNICGTQFHPEKSGQAGLRMLRCFAAQGGEPA